MATADHNIEVNKLTIGMCSCELKSGGGSDPAPDALQRKRKSRPPQPSQA